MEEKKEETVEKVRYSDEELQEFKELILQKLAKARRDYQMLQSQIDHSSSNDTEDTSPSFKVLEEGSRRRRKPASWRPGSTSSSRTWKPRSSVSRTRPTAFAGKRAS